MALRSAISPWRLARDLPCGKNAFFARQTFSASNGGRVFGAGVVGSTHPSGGFSISDGIFPTHRKTQRRKFTAPFNQHTRGCSWNYCKTSAGPKLEMLFWRVTLGVGIIWWAPQSATPKQRGNTHKSPKNDMEAQDPQDDSTIWITTDLRVKRTQMYSGRIRTITLIAYQGCMDPKVSFNPVKDVAEERPARLLFHCATPQNPIVIKPCSRPVLLLQFDPGIDVVRQFLVAAGHRIDQRD